MKMEKIIIVILAVLISGALIMTAVTPQEIQIIQANGQENTISVDGSGEVYASPDVAIVNIGLETRNDVASIAQEENTKIMNNVIEAMKEMSIESKDIKTQYYNMYRSYDYNNNENEYFIVNNTFQITVRDIEKIGEVIDKAVSLGANQINNIQFTLSDQNESYQEAMDLAYENAKVKAERIAEKMGKTISDVLSVSESSYNSPIYMESVSMRADGVAPVESGELVIKANVAVIFKY
ncbi:MAG: SIMPL domain-containing protein [Clostridiales bacterium]|nr:SIMPL domain-containing protein [Clostridiales bacterium]